MMPWLLSFSPVTMNRMLIRSQLMHLRVYLLVSCFLFLIFDESAADELHADPLILDLLELWCRYGGFNPLPA
jgi:hypothetical protein